METNQRKYFIQVGATRDALDPYLDCARRRGLLAVLVETPDYLSLRKDLGLRAFDVEVAMHEPNNLDAILHALKAQGITAANTSLILPGFDRYSYSSYQLAKMMQIAPFNSEQREFIPLDKDQQRAILRQKYPQVAQPRFYIWKSGETFPKEKISFPFVMKPVNGAGSLGVALVENIEQFAKACQLLGRIKNFDGDSFPAFLLEEYVPGTEYSIQGITVNGIAHVLSFCEKVVVQERLPINDDLVSFREAAHLSSSGTEAPAAFLQFAQDCVDACGYENGAFHIDFIENDQKLYFLEMGFRLSGGRLSELLTKLDAIDWAELAFATHLYEEVAIKKERNQLLPKHIGVAAIRSEDILAKVRSLNHPECFIDIQPITINSVTIATQKVLGKSLQADISKHGNVIARVWISSNTASAIKTLFSSFLSTQINASQQEALCVDLL